MSTSLNYLEGLAGTMASGVTSSLIQDRTQEPTQDKVETLKQNAEAKLSRLSSNILPKTNDYSAAELQQMLSDAVDKQVYTNDDGSKYQQVASIGPDGNAQIAKVPYTATNKYGTVDTRNLYIDNTVNGDMKLGLARSDKGFIGRYTPDGKGYGWTPGPEGVTPQDGALLDIELPYDVATKFEYLTHSNKGQIENRAMGTGPIVPEVKQRFGKGITEYTTQNAPMWNIDYVSPEKSPIAKDTPMPNYEEAAKALGIKTYALGEISKKYESGGDVSAIAPDTNNTTSYGIYQMNSAGTMQNFLNSPEGAIFGSHLNKHEIGSQDFNATYKKLAANYGDRLAEAQQSYMQRTHFEPIARMAEENGINVNDPKIQEALWSQSVQHSPQGNAQIVKNAVASLGDSATQDEVVQALYNSRNAYVQGLSTIDNKTKAQLANRYSNEMNDVLNGAPVTVTVNEKSGRTVADQIINFPKAVAQGAIKTGVVDTADFVGEITGLWNIGTEKEKETLVKQVTNYNSEYADKYMKANETILTSNLQDIPENEKGIFDNAIEDISGKNGMLNNMNKIISNLDSKETTELLSNAFANTDTTGYSIGMLVGLVAGTKGAGLGKVVLTGEKTAQATIQAIKDSSALNKAQKTVAIGEVYKKAYENASVLQKSINQIGKNSGLLTINAGQVNDQLDEFEKNTGRKATAQEVGEKYLLNLGGLLLDRTADIGLIKGVASKETIEALSNLIKFTPNNTGLKLAQDSAKLISKLALAGGTEFLQEGSQTAIEELNKIDIRTDKGQQQYKEKVVDILNAAFSGVGGAVHMATPTAGYEYVKDVSSTLKKGRELATKTNVNEVVPEDIEEPVDLKAEMSNIMNRVAENGVVSTADMTSIKKMEEQLIAKPEEAQEQKLAAINNLKSRYKAQLLDPENDTVVLKSKRDLMYAMQDIGEVDDAVDEVLYAKAVKAGIVKDKEEYANIKKDFAVVDAEAKSGRIGYLTLTRDLENLLDASSPNTGKVDKLVKRLINYEKTQQDYLNKGTELYNRVQKEIEAYNAPNDTNLPRKTPKSASSVEMENGYKFTIYTELDANGKVQIKSNKALQDILEAKRLNIAGIKEGLQSVAGKLDSIGLSAADTGVTNKPIINAKGNKWLDSLAKDLKGSESTPEATHIYAIGSGKRATAIKESNLSGTNLTDYTKDSVVFMTMDKATTQDDVDKLKKELGTKTSELHKAITAAKEAGATIRLDAILRPKSKDKAGNAVKDPHALEALRLLQEALTNYGNEYRSVPSETSNFSFTFKPKAEVEAMKESTKTAKEAKEAVTKKVDVEGYKEYRNLDSVKAQEAYAKSLWNSDEAIQAQYKSTDTKEGWEKLLNRFQTISANSVKEISAELSAIIDLEKQIKDTTGLTGVDKTQAVMFNEDIENQIAELKDAMDKKYHKKDYAIAETNAKDTAKRLESIGDIIQEIKEIAQNTSLDEEAKAAAIQELLKDVDGDVAKTILDTSISKGKKTDTYKNYVVPLDINNIVKIGKNTVLSVAPVEYLFKKLANHPEISSVRYIDDMKKAFEKLFVVNADKPYVKGEGGTLDLQLRTESAVGLFYNKDGELNDTMLMAGQLALDEYMANNGEMLNPAYKSRENIAQMLGVIESQLGKNQEKLLRDKGMFYKTAANKVGKAAIQKMGYVAKKDATDVEREAYDRLAADVGNRILLAGVANGILERDSIPSTEYGEAIAKDSQKSTAKRAEFVDSDADIAFIKFTKEFIAKDKDGVSKRSVRTDVYREIHSLIGDENSFRKMPSENPIKNPRYVKEQVAKDIAGMQIPGMANTDKDKNTPAQFMKHLVDTKWEVNNELIAKMLKDVNIDVLKMHLGYASAEDLDNMSFDSRESAEAKNMDIEKSIEELKMFVDEKGQMNAELYFDWFYSSNGRYMMDSNTLNPQTDKLHRFLIQPAEHKLKYTVKDGKFTKKSMESLVNYAIAQAFGFKVDKKSTVKIMKAGELLRKADPKALSKVLFGSKGKNGVKDVHKRFKLTEDGDVILPTAKGYEESNAVEFEPDHISHAIQAIDMLEKIKTGGTFTSSLTAEFDALTSGFGLKLLQIPIIGNELVGLWDWLNKVGVLEKGKATADSMNDILDGAGQKFYDSYQTLAKEVEVTEESVQEAIANKGKNYKKLSANVVNSLWNDAGLGALMPKVGDDGTVTSALRSLFKDPFMTFNYSAGIASIKRSLAGVLTSGLIDRIVAGEKGTEQPTKALLGLVVVDKNNSYKVPKTVEEFQQLLKDMPLDRIKVKAGNIHTLEEYLNEVMDLTYGHSVETIMKEHFQEFMDVHDTVNSAFKLMFTAWKQEYDKEIKLVPIGKLNDDKVKEILDKLRDKFPLIKSPLSDELNEGVAIYKSSSLTPSDEEVRYMPSRATTDTTAMKSIGVKNKETGEGVASVKVRHMIRAFEAAISSGSVVPIHYIDGALMAQLMGEDITAIHDAIMPPLNKAIKTIKKYNQAMFDISKSYSWIKEINEMLKRLDVNTLDNTVKVEVKEKVDGKTTYSEKGLKDAVETMQSKLETLTDRVTIAREEVFSKIGAIGHMVGLPGSMWTAKGVKLGATNKQTYEEVIATPAEIAAIKAANDKFQKDNNPEYQRKSNLLKARMGYDADVGLADTIRARLMETYPEVSVTIFDKLVDENGVEVLGRAIGTAVEYNPNKAGLDTLPHEYAHIYVNLLEKTTFVNNLISKVAKENNVSRYEAKEIIVTQMGENYVHKAKGIKEIKVGIIKGLWYRIISYLSNSMATKIKEDIGILSSRFYDGLNKDAIRTTPKEGFEKVDTEATFKDQPFAADVLKTIMKKAKGKAKFTGSAALALQGDIYRKGEKGITDLHDLDFAVDDLITIENIGSELWRNYTIIGLYDFSVIQVINNEGVEKAVKSYIVTDKKYKIPEKYIRYKGSRIQSYKITDSYNNVVGTYGATITEGKLISETTTGVKAVIVDLLENSNSGTDKTYFSQTLQTEILLKDPGIIFDAKNSMGTEPRDKDVLDFNSFYKEPKQPYSFMLKEEFKNKLILANSGSGKSYISNNTENVVDSDVLLAKILGTSVADIVTVLENRDIDEVYKELATAIKKELAKGKTVLSPSTNKHIVAIADVAIIQNDHYTVQSRAGDSSRDNPISRSTTGTKASIKLFKDNTKDISTIELNSNETLADVLYMDQGTIEYNTQISNDKQKVAEEVISKLTELTKGKDMKSIQAIIDKIKGC